MPRQYSNRPGSVSSPSPIQFGAAELNLGTPRFVAQTNVDPGVNILAEIQQVLGMAAKVGIQAVEYDTQQIKQKINYEAALQQKTDRETMRVEREESRRIREESRRGTEEARQIGTLALERERIVASDMPEEAKKKALEDIRQRAIALGEEAGTAQGVTAAASQAQQVGTDIDKINPNRAFVANMQSSIASLEAGKDLDGAVALQKSLLDELETVGDNTEKRAVLASALASANGLVQRLQANEERDTDALARAAAARLSEQMAPAVISITAKLSDPGVLGAISSASNGAIGEAAFDAVRDQLAFDYPEYAAILANESTSEYEISAINRVIEKAADTIASKAFAYRKEAAEEQAKDIHTDRLKTDVNTDGWEKAVQNAFLDNSVSYEAKSQAQQAAAAAYIEDGDSPLVSLQRAVEVQGSEYSSSAARAFAGRAVTRIVNDAANNVGTRPSEFDPSTDIAIGWVREYDNRDGFLDHVAGSLGVSREQVDADPSRFGPLGTKYLEFKKQYDADTTASIRQETRLTNAANAGAGRKKELDVDDIFDLSTLGRAIQDPELIGAMTADQIRLHLQVDTVGYAGGRAPQALVKALKDNYSDPRYARLNAEFWAAHTSAVNPTLHIDLDEDSRQARLAGAVWQQIVGLRGVDNNQANTMYQDAVTLMRSQRDGVGKIEGKDPKVQAANKEVGRALDAMFTGAGYAVDGTFWSVDDIDFNGADLYTNMNSLDQANFNDIYLAATAFTAAVPGMDPVAVTSNLMQQTGYRPFVTQDGKPGLIYNPTLQSDDGTLYTAMPTADEITSKKYKEYLFDKADAAAAVINDRRTDKTGTPIKRKDIASVEPYYNDIDAARGRFGATITLKTGGKIRLSPDEMNIGGLDWIEYSKTKK